MTRGAKYGDRFQEAVFPQYWQYLLILGVGFLAACKAPEKAQSPTGTPIELPPPDAGAAFGTGGAPLGTGTGGSEGQFTTDADADGSVVTLSPAGTACRLDDDCESGACADQVCCATRCIGPCRSCALPGSLGRCLPADVGTDPRNDCTDDTAANCGNDGTCDGAGQCRRYPVATICSPATCVGSMLTAASRCGAAGCVAATAQPCDPFLCGTNAACLKTCRADADCVTPNSCVNGRCGKKPLGATCEGDDECNSSHCAQGVCCGDACNATCNSCAVQGSEGKCTLVPPGKPDPLNQCARSEPASCGLDGTCNGAGSCRSWVAGTICKTAGCASAVQTPAELCDGQGMCRSAPPLSCGDYLCDINARCRVGCATNADCVAPAICASGVCGGILARYFSDDSLTNLVLTRTEPQLNNIWGIYGPPGGAVPTDIFSARYTGTVTPRFSETYTFYLNADDGVRMWVNDAPIIDDWTGHVLTEDLGTIALRANEPAAIRIEYFEKTGEAQISLSWSSFSEPKALVPTSRLSPRM